MFGDINPSTLATNFRFCYHPLSQIKLETKIQASPLGKSVDGSSRSYLDEIVGTAEYLGESSTISLALYNPKCETGRMTIGFLGSFNNNFCAGVELLSEWMRNQVDYKLAIAMRYARLFSVSKERNVLAQKENCATQFRDAWPIFQWPSFHESNAVRQTKTFTYTSLRKNITTGENSLLSVCTQLTCLSLSLFHIALAALIEWAPVKYSFGVLHAENLIISKIQLAFPLYVALFFCHSAIGLLCIRR